MAVWVLAWELGLGLMLEVDGRLALSALVVVEVVAIGGDV
jgi:hypothetical protein